MVPRRSTLRYISLTALLVTMACLCPRALAKHQPPTYASVDWMVANSDLIIRGKVVGSSSLFWVVEVVETFKGPRLERFLLPTSMYWASPPAPLISHRVLLFLRQRKVEGMRVPLVYVPREYWGRGSDWAWDFDGPSPAELSHHAFGMDFRELTTQSQLIDAARAAVAAHAEGSAAQIFYSSQFTLVVPVDHRLEALGQGWLHSDDPDRRGHALAASRHFHTPANVRLLRQFAANDPTMQSTGYYPPRGRWASAEYDLRQKAFDLLKEWHAEGARPALVAPDDLYRPLLGLWPLAAGVGLAAILLGLLRRRRGQRPFKRAMMRPATLLVFCGALLLVLWVRSYRRADELLIHDPHLDCQLASFRGRLQFARVSGDTMNPVGGPGTYLLTCPLGTFMDTIWSDPFTTYWGPPRLSTDWHWCGLTHQVGTCTRPSYDKPSTPTAFTFLRIPIWPAVALTLLPGLWLLIRSTLRRRHRLRAGLCLACGYNLTGNVSGVCPECGAPATAAPPISAKVAATS